MMMEDHIIEALGIVKAQAGFRSMTEDEICTMVRGIADVIKNLLDNDKGIDALHLERISMDRTPKENSIVCLECLKPFKMLTHKHMATHELTPEEYRSKWGYAKGAPLVCKSLQRLRRKKMKDIKLWEKRRKDAPAKTQVQS